MMNRDLHPFDLQIQTTASDGKHSPAECVRMAKENGVTAIAITDHDTVAGVEEAVIRGVEIGVEVIPGVELSVQEHGIHLLGLGIDMNHQGLLAALKIQAARRIAAAQQMVKSFQDAGFSVRWEDVQAEAGGGIVARPHIVSVIMKDPKNAKFLSNVRTKHDFFQKYFTDASPHYIRASALTPAEAISLIRGAGGIAVWSHPPIPDFIGNYAALEKFLQELISFGLDGLELCGSFATADDVTHLVDLVHRYRLIPTAGSDFHERYDPGGAPWPRAAAEIGEYPVYHVELTGMLERVREAIADRQRRYQAARRTGGAR